MATKIIICDDNEQLAKSLEDKINISLQNLKEDHLKYKNLKVDIKVFIDALRLIGYSTIADLSQSILFLDIELNHNQNGVNIAEQIRKANPNAQIIFITSYNKYAPLTYQKRIGAIDYINKSDENIMVRINETLFNAFEALENAQKIDHAQFTYKIGRRVQRINKNDIAYITSTPTQHRVNMITKTGEASFRSHIGDLEKENDFLVRVSQSCLINPENISKVDISTRTITLFENIDVEFTRTYRPAVDKLVKQLEK